jgi:magnesium transporter
MLRKSRSKKQKGAPSRHYPAQYTKKVGQIPGELVYVGDKANLPTAIKVIAYDEQNQHFVDIDHPDNLAKVIDTHRTTWINVDGVSDLAKIKVIADYFNFHPLMGEDIVNTEHLPKLQEYDSHLFFAMKMLKIIPETNDLDVEHLSLVLGPNYVISFQEEKEGDVFQHIRDRIKAKKGRVCRMGADYLFYLLIDAIVDHYFLVLEGIRQRVEDMEESLLLEPQHNIIPEITELKKQFSYIRKLVFPLQEEVQRLVVGEYEDFIQEATMPYFRDVLDHVKHLTSSFETFRDTLYSLMDLYMSNLSHSMNSVMKTLTVITTVFIPLTFIAGIYGMNFKHMPELEFPWAYPLVLGLMLCLGVGMLIYSRSRQWF